MSNSPQNPQSSPKSRTFESIFEDTERYFFTGQSATNGHHHDQPTGNAHSQAAASTPAMGDAVQGDQLPAFGEHLNQSAPAGRPGAAPSPNALAGAPRQSIGRSGAWTAAALVVGLAALWFLVSELTSATSMQGSTVGNLIQLRAEVAGVVDEVSTAEADEVCVGQTVARLGASGISAQLARLEEVLDLKRLEAEQVQRAITEEKQRLQLLHEISKRTETSLGLGIEELGIQLELATELAGELRGSVNRGSAKRFEFLEAESNRLRLAKRLEEQEAELDLQKLITANAAQGRHYHNGIVRSWLDELQLNAAKVATEIGQTEVEAATLRTTVAQSTVTTHRDGRVFAVHHPTGSSVQAGDPIVTLETDDPVWIIASFKYAEAEDIAYGDRAVIDFPALDSSITGRVVAIGHNVISAVDTSSPFLRLTPEEVLVKIEPDGAIDELRSGISAKVRIRTGGLDPFHWLAARFGTEKADTKPSEKSTTEKEHAPTLSPPRPPTPQTTPAVSPYSGQPISPMNSPFDFSQSKNQSSAQP